LEQKRICATNTSFDIHRQVQKIGDKTASKVAQLVNQLLALSKLNQ
jgi:hypothetical protein